MPLAGASGAAVARTPSGPTFSLTPTAGPPGATVMAFSVTPCPSGATFALVGFSPNRNEVWEPGVIAATDPAGTWSVTFRVPAVAAVGVHTVGASCHSGKPDDSVWLSNYRSVTFRVTH